MREDQERHFERRCAQMAGHAARAPTQINADDLESPARHEPGFFENCLGRLRLPEVVHIFKESGVSQRECKSTPICVARVSGRICVICVEVPFLVFPQFPQFPRARICEPFLSSLGSQQFRNVEPLKTSKDGSQKAQRPLSGAKVQKSVAWYSRLLAPGL